MKNVSPQEGKVMMGRKLFLMTYRKWLNETQKLPRAEVPLPLLLRGTERGGVASVHTAAAAAAASP